MKHDKNLIPKGKYCYELLESFTDENGSLITKIRRCPYWKMKIVDSDMNWQEPYCEIIGFEMSDNWKIENQLKICNMNMEENGS